MSDTLRVLIVDDDPGFCKTLGDILREEFVLGSKCRSGWMLVRQRG